MPTTRKSTGGTRGRTGPTKGQSTISFHNKVTKNVGHDAKKAVVSSPAVAKVEPEKLAEEEVVEVVTPAAEEEEEEEPEIETKEVVPEKSEAEIKAEKVSDAQIAKYWKGIEKLRVAPRVHQEQLSLSEKVLRYFDVSSQYGVSLHIRRAQLPGCFLDFGHIG